MDQSVVFVIANNLTNRIIDVDEFAKVVQIATIVVVVAKAVVSNTVVGIGNVVVVGNVRNIVNNDTILFVVSQLAVVGFLVFFDPQGLQLLSAHGHCVGLGDMLY